MRFTEYADMPDDTENQDTGPDDLTPSQIAGLRAGDPQAAAVLEKLYRMPLIRFCWGYLGRVEDAEDAVQDITCKVLGSKSLPDVFRPWLYKTARNHCLNLLRQRGRRRDDEKLPSGSQLRDTLTGQLTRLVRTERQDRVNEFVERLPENQREVLRLRYVEGLARSEIAEVLETPERVIKSRLFEGLKRLRDMEATGAES